MAVDFKAAKIPVLKKFCDAVNKTSEKIRNKSHNLVGMEGIEPSAS